MKKTRFVLWIILVMNFLPFIALGRSEEALYIIGDDSLTFSHTTAYLNEGVTFWLDFSNSSKQLDVTYSQGKVWHSLGHAFYSITPIDKANSHITIKVDNDSVVIPLIVNTIHHAKARIKGWDKSFIYLSEIDSIEAVEVVDSNDVSCEIKSFTISATVGGFTKNYKSKSNKLTNQQINLLKSLKYGGRAYFQDIDIITPLNEIKRINHFILNVKPHRKIDFIKESLRGQKPDRIRHTNLRIKVTGNPSKQEMQYIRDFTNDLDTLLSTIDVKLVEWLPNLVIEFTEDDTDHKEYDPVFLYPGLIIYDKKLFGNKYIELRKLDIQNLVYEQLGYFSHRFIRSEYSNSSWDVHADKRWLLRQLYSKDGLKEIKSLFPESKKEKDNSLLVISLITILFLFIFTELNNKYGLIFKLEKITNSIITRTTVSVLIALLIVLVTLGYFSLFNKSKIWYDEWNYVKELALFFSIFAILFGNFLLLIDHLLKQFKPFWLNLILDFLLTVFGFALVYQVIFLFVQLEPLNVQMINWDRIVIPVTIVLYRFYMKYERNKITHLLQEKEFELVKQKELKTKAQLSALQARINPHFLYNSLNSIASYAGTDAGKTSAMALGLSKLFRYNLNKEDEHFTTIAKEVEMVQAYLEIEKNRFGDQLEYTIEVDESLKSFEIPKFLLQPLVENAIKHGTSKISEQGEIKLKIHPENSKVIIEVYDNGPSFPDGLLTGYGLLNITEKLKLIYKKPFELKFVNEGDKHLKIVLDK